MFSRTTAVGWVGPHSLLTSTCGAVQHLQYCGGGYGVKDVVYLLASSVDSSVLQKHEDALLQHYHQQLVGALGPERGSEYTLDIMTNHFRLALLDYVRFMAG